MDHLRVELHALGVDGVGIPGRGDEALLRRGTFDDLGVEALEGLHLVGIAAAGRREGRRSRRDDAKFWHECFLRSG